MDMNAIREYICSNEEIKSLIGDNVFLFEKPEQITAKNYILYNFKEISGGQSIRDYQLDIRIVGKDKLKLLQIKDVLITMLDNFNRNTNIKDDTTIIRHAMAIGSGFISTISTVMNKMKESMSLIAPMPSMAHAGDTLFRQGERALGAVSFDQNNPTTSTAQTPTSSDVNIYGDISLPNVQSADQFVSELRNEATNRRGKF